MSIRLAGALAGALATAVLLPASARAQPYGTAAAVMVSMKGTMAKDQSAAADAGWGGISFGFTGDNAGKIRWFGVVHASLFGNDTFAAKSAVFRASAVPALTIAGPPALAQKLFALPDGTKVQIEGLVDRESKNVMLDLVEPLQ